MEETGKLFSFMRSLQAPLDVKGGRRVLKNMSNYSARAPSKQVKAALRGQSSDIFTQFRKLK